MQCNIYFLCAPLERGWCAVGSVKEANYIQTGYFIKIVQGDKNSASIRLDCLLSPHSIKCMSGIAKLSISSVNLFLNQCCFVRIF